MERIVAAADEKAAAKIATYGAEIMTQVERSLLLQILDQSWKEHLLALLRQGINLRAYGQRDPLNEYKREAFQLFAAMLDDVREQVTRYVANLEFRNAPMEDIPPPPPMPEMREIYPDPATALSGGGEVLEAAAGVAVAGIAGAGAAVALADDAFAKTPRNAPCPCGSGRKYKHCHGSAG